MPSLRKRTLTPEALSLTKQEIDALLWVHKGLMNGTIKSHHSRQKVGAFLNMFTTMDILHYGGKCRAVGCIAGWAALYLNSGQPKDWATILGSNLYLAWSGRTDALNALVNARSERHHFGHMTARPRQTARAIENFLTTGHPQWDEAVQAVRK